MTSAYQSSLFWFWCLALWLAVPAIAGQSPPGLADTRVLIDVSGSMKKNDPDNLRRPALRLLVGLLPQNSRAGVWTFGRYANMEVKWGKVDAQWRKLADQGASKIHSRGQFTNIERALQRATSGWENADPGSRRNLRLLTDGKVDIAKVKPLLFDMASKRYWALGPSLGNCWGEGKKLKKKLQQEGRPG